MQKQSASLLNPWVSCTFVSSSHSCTHKGTIYLDTQALCVSMRGKNGLCCELLVASMARDVFGRPGFVVTSGHRRRNVPRGLSESERDFGVCIVMQRSVSCRRCWGMEGTAIRMSERRVGMLGGFRVVVGKCVGALRSELLEAAWVVRLGSEQFCVVLRTLGV